MGGSPLYLDANRDSLPDVYVTYGTDSIVLYDGATRASFWIIANPHPGNTVYTVATGNTGVDAWPQLMVATYRYTTSPTVYYGRFDIYDCGNHQLLFSSPEMSSNYTLVSAQPVDIDGDGRCEICVSGGDSTARTLQVYGWSSGVEESSRPSVPRLSVAPSVSRSAVVVTGLPPNGFPVRITDVCGRVVRTLAHAGPGPVVWDGTDDHSRPVPPGCYLVQADGQVTKVITLP